MNKIKNLIAEHHKLLIKFLSSSKEIEILDANTDYELLNQILSSRDKQSKVLFSIFQKIESLKDSINPEQFLELIKENDELLKEILEIDSKNEKKIENIKNEVEIQLNSISSKKNVLNNYHVNKTELPTYISKI